MPAGNVNTVDRVKRLRELKDLLDEGKTQRQIEEITGMSSATIVRNKKYLEELSVADLTPKDIAAKRSDIELDLLEVADIVKNQISDLLEDTPEHEAKPGLARNYVITYLDIIKTRMQLYGLDNVKSDVGLTQINNYIGSREVEKVNSNIADKIRSAIIGSHESSVGDGE